MNICISGGNGLIGKNLVPFLRNKGYKCIQIDRETIFNREKLKYLIDNSSAFINLSGFPINKYWTRKVKRNIIESRIQTTKAIVQAISELKKENYCYITASGINIYKSGTEHTENSKNLDNGFLSRVVQEWEAASLRLDVLEVRRVVLRLSPVICKRGGIIDFLRLSGKFPLVILWGGDKHRFNFIYIKDLMEVFQLALENPKVYGIINAVAPKSEYTWKVLKSLAGKRMGSLNIPNGLVRAGLGESAELLLWSAEVIPEMLNNVGFKFKFPSWNEIMNDMKKDG